MKRLRFDAWSDLGWQGFLLRVPAEWNPGRITGDFKTGSLRLDDTEVVRVEMEWREAKGELSVSGVVDRFAEGLTREAQKKKGRLSIQRRIDVGNPGDGVLEGDQEVVFWESDCRVYALTRYCPRTQRIVFVRVIGRHEEDLARVAKDILGTFTDQPPEGVRTWALYDTKCAIPSGFQLETCALRSGHIRLRFAHGKAVLQVDRLSMAGMMLKGATLGAWLEGFHQKELRDLNRTVTSGEIHGHGFVRTRGNPKSRWRTMLSPLPFLEVRARSSLDCVAWHCAESNKIYSVLHLHKEGEDAVSVEEVCRGVVCHRAESPDQPGGDARLPARAQ